MLMILVGSLAFAQEKSLLLTYQGEGAYSGIGIQSEDIPLLRDKMINLIKEGRTPIVIEGDWEVIWLYLNDTYDPRDWVEIDFESEYSDEIQDLFPIKTNNKIRKILKKKWDNNKLMETLGIRYQIENDEVVSIIDYEKFEKYL